MGRAGYPIVLHTVRKIVPRRIGPRGRRSVEPSETAVLRERWPDLARARSVL